MDEKQILRELEADLQSAPAKKVVYLEGKTDPEVFYALAGKKYAAGDLLDGVLVKGLRDKKSGTGCTSVINRVEVAQKCSYPGIYGILDGDGLPYSNLVKRFDSPFSGPLFYWKTYCIENLLVKSCWPETWETAPDWAAEFRNYAPYTALNRIHATLQQALTSLGLKKFVQPAQQEALLTKGAVLAKLEQGKNLIAQHNVAEDFEKEVGAFEQSLGNLDEAHALLNGKWIFSDFIPRKFPSKTPETARNEWIAALIAAGGNAEVKEFWNRLKSF
ncbi:TPA: hypothetical protein DDW35_06005 [Candidatus Sumerlaeota bacterium]|jgi:hypothetical protein|nr:hypothetical protein [Candidatus Sumerlaeota bacterium]